MEIGKTFCGRTDVRTYVRTYGRTVTPEFQSTRSSPRRWPKNAITPFQWRVEEFAAASITATTILHIVLTHLVVLRTSNKHTTLLVNGIIIIIHIIKSYIKQTPKLYHKQVQSRPKVHAPLLLLLFLQLMTFHDYYTSRTTCVSWHPQLRTGRLC